MIDPAAPPRRQVIRTLILRAYQLAGLMNAAEGAAGAQWPSRMALAKDFLENIVDELVVFGASPRWTDLVAIPLTSGEETYSLTDATLDLVGQASFIPASSAADLNQAAGTSIVAPISLEDWLCSSAKSSSGRPRFYVVHKTEDVLQVSFCPVPDETGSYVRFQTIRHAANCNLESATLDLEPYWYNYIVHKLASQLAMAHSMAGEAQMLLSIAAESLVYCRTASRRSESVQARLVHR